ncbi:MAG: DUF3089 domain-containing protein [Sediminibacterium sp.]|nr:DUF3089 domain-containing protein [Sediminibacterium sp.]
MLQTHFSSIFYRLQKIILTAGLLFVSLLSYMAYAQHYIIPTRFHESPIPPAPRYNMEENWSALPFRKDFGDLVPNGYTDNQEHAEVDVFYIHPTLYGEKPTTVYKWNHDLNDPKLNKEIDEVATKFQATAFNGAGKLYVPRYRQAHYSVFLTQHLDDKQAALNVAYSDIDAAFSYYIEHLNDGRPFIIASHSQGTIHAARLLKYRIIGTALQQQLVVAYLPGMAVPKDSLIGLPVCQEPNSIGCFTSWSTYERNFIPTTYFNGLNNAVCVNPITWKFDDSLTVSIPQNPTPAVGDKNTLDSNSVEPPNSIDQQTTINSDPPLPKRGHYCPKEMHRGAVLKPFGKVYPQICDAQVFGGLLWITKPKFPGAFLYRTSNFHSGDINLFYIDIRENAILRAKTFVQQKAISTENIRN